jgi:uncharacterized protein (TIGR00299 family) protein
VHFLGIEGLFASAIPLGSGFIKTAHGNLPAPAPATLALLKGISVYDSGLEHELVTPTGAALLINLVRSFGMMPPMKIEQTGYGVGSQSLNDRPNLLRLIIGQDQPEKQVETVIILEANLDDANPEWVGFLMERLFEEGALDVVFTPVQMKKNRPAVQIQVIGRPEQGDRLMDLLFRESTTLGIRFQYNQRKILPRSTIELESPWGKLRVKKVLQADGRSWLIPEYEACKHVAEQHRLPMKEIYSWVTSMNRGSEVSP